MASDITLISYGDYLELIKKASSNSSELKSLKNVFPNIIPEQYDYLHNEVAKLETALIESTIKRFEKKLRSSLTEFDADILVIGLRDLKRNIDDCLFFLSIDLYPDSIKDKIGHEVINKFLEFSSEIDAYMLKLLKASSNDFVEDLRYIVKRAKLQKFIQGYEGKI